jgi:CheY-like chemotaxis protein
MRDDADASAPAGPGGQRDPAVPATRSGRPAIVSRRVLVVDDNADAAESAALFLRLAGHVVEVAFDGRAALEAARAFRPEVVFLDIGLPGMNGYEVARRLRQEPEFRSAVLAAVTGYGREEDRRRSKESGFDFHLVKPVEPASLLNLVSVLRRPGDGGPTMSHR